MSDSISLWDKRCSKCDQIKPLDEFPYEKQHGKRYNYAPACKACKQRAYHAWYEKNRAANGLPPSEKTCAKCDETKPIEHFVKDKRTRNSFYLWCAECRSLSTKKRLRDWGDKNSDRIRGSNLRKAYGITLEEYDAMFAAQRGLCAVCHYPETMINHYTKAASALAVDHDHATGKVRGLLCQRCNHALGLLKEDPIRIESLLNYIKIAKEGT